MKCTSCQNEVKVGKFCPKCGKPLPKVKYCTKCGAELNPTSKFCIKCGSPNESFIKPEPQSIKPETTESQASVKGNVDQAPTPAVNNEKQQRAPQPPVAPKPTDIRKEVSQPTVPPVQIDVPEQEEAEEYEKESNGKKWVWVWIILALAIIGAGIGCYIYLTNNSGVTVLSTEGSSTAASQETNDVSSSSDNDNSSAVEIIEPSEETAEVITPETVEVNPVSVPNANTVNSPEAYSIYPNYVTDATIGDNWATAPVIQNLQTNNLIRNRFSTTGYIHENSIEMDGVITKDNRIYARYRNANGTKLDANGVIDSNGNLIIKLGHGSATSYWVLHPTVKSGASSSYAGTWGKKGLQTEITINKN